MMTLCLQKEIGKGSFGTVFSGTYYIEKCKQKVAIKKIKSNTNGVPFLMELSIMSTYKHRNVNTAHNIYLKNDNIYIIQPLANVLNLKDYLKYNFVSFKNKMVGIGWLFEGISFLHKHHIVHLDLKASNILISDIGEWKIADFTLSTKFGWKISQKPCTITHRPPEVFLGEYTLNPKIDSWSLGCTLYQIIYEQLLFRKQKDKNGYTMAIDDFCYLNGYKVRKVDTYKSYIKPSCFLKSKKLLQVNNWILKLLNPNPNERITVSDIIGVSSSKIDNKMDDKKKLCKKMVKCVGNRSSLTEITVKWIVDKLMNGEHPKPKGIPTYKLLLEEKNILTKIKFKLHM